MNMSNTTNPRDPQESLPTGLLERDLDAMARSLASGSITEMPHNVAIAVRERAQSRSILRASAWLSAVACAVLVGVVVVRMAAPRSPGLAEDAPATHRPTLERASLPASSVAAIRSATRGLDGSALLDSIPSPASPGRAIAAGVTGDAILRLGESLDSPRARMLLEVN